MPIPVRTLSQAVPGAISKVDDFLDDFMFSQDYVTLDRPSREGHAQVVDLDLGRVTRNSTCRGCRTWRPGSPGNTRGAL